MLGKRDHIFWAASATFLLSLVLTATAGQQWLLLMAVAYLLRPTLHSLGFARKLIDERQLQIQYRAGNVAFAALLIGNAVMLLHLMRRDDHTWEMVEAVVVVALAVRALAGLLLVGDPAVAGQRILISVGLLVSLFTALDAGFPGLFIAVLPGLVLVALGFTARRWPRAIAGVLSGMTLLLVPLILGLALRRPGGANWGTALAIGLIVVPLGLSAFCLWRGASASAEDFASPEMPAAERGAGA